MKRYSARFLIALVALTLGIGAGTFWIKRRMMSQHPSAIPSVALMPDEKESAIELVFRDMIQSHEAHPTYFLSFGPADDPADSFVARFKDSSVVIKKLSEAGRNGPQVIDRETGNAGAQLRFGFYKPISESECVVATGWEYWKTLGEKPEGELESYEYRLQKIEGTWAIKSRKLEPLMFRTAQVSIPKGWHKVNAGGHFIFYVPPSFKFTSDERCEECGWGSSFANKRTNLYAEYTSWNEEYVEEYLAKQAEYLKTFTELAGKRVKIQSWRSQDYAPKFNYIAEARFYGADGKLVARLSADCKDRPDVDVAKQIFMTVSEFKP